jgi:hypothetical protein
MSKTSIITGITVSQQMSKAEEILKTQVIPRDKAFQEKKKSGLISKTHIRVKM